VIVSAPQSAGYVPFISAASFVNVHPSAGVFGASGAPGSQALYRQPFGDSGRLAQVGLSGAMYAGRKRVFAAVQPAAYHVGMSVNAVDQAGNAGATAVAYRPEGWQLVDLGTFNVATTTPTTTLNIYTGQPYRTSNDRQFMRPLATGAGASSLGAVAGVYVLPEENTQAVVDRNAQPVVRSFFGASGAATGALTAGFVGELGEMWTRIAGANDLIVNASGAYGQMAVGNSALFVANKPEMDNFRARAIIHPGTADLVPFNFGARRPDGLGYVLTNVTPLATSQVLVTVTANSNTIASMVLASQAGMPAYPGVAQGLVVDMERRARGVVSNARLSGASGIGYIPSAGMTATVVPVACVAATSALSNSQAGLPLFGWSGAGGITPSSWVSFLRFDRLRSVAQPSEAYRLTNVAADTPLRSPITGSGPNVSLEGARIGADLKLNASSVAVTVVDWQLDGGPMNDPMGVEVRCRERWTYAR
jgi:hypothetical protein